MIHDESGSGCDYSTTDIQNSALESTSSVLEMSVDSSERKMVKLFHLCHSKLEAVVPRDTLVRLVRSTCAIFQEEIRLLLQDHDNI
ncbi:uncharacterized protein M6B38_327795 [Iris pallida]|uniref:Uncharacterized protein n=1 Tax=Iris pallida TaxID=29817 RepID=A0AAX6H5Z8_IRIPA|nr:uncharacterized protein M6B38_327795 [Iris pallida]